MNHCLGEIPQKDTPKRQTYISPPPFPLPGYDRYGLFMLGTPLSGSAVKIILKQIELKESAVYYACKPETQTVGDCVSNTVVNQGKVV